MSPLPQLSLPKPGDRLLTPSATWTTAGAPASQPTAGSHPLGIPPLQPAGFYGLWPFLPDTQCGSSSRSTEPPAHGGPLYTLSPPAPNSSASSPRRLANSFLRPGAISSSAVSPGQPGVVRPPSLALSLSHQAKSLPRSREAGEGLLQRPVQLTSGPSAWCCSVTRDPRGVHCI